VPIDDPPAAVLLPLLPPALLPLPLTAGAAASAAAAAGFAASAAGPSWLLLLLLTPDLATAAGSCIACTAQLGKALLLPCRSVAQYTTPWLTAMIGVPCMENMGVSVHNLEAAAVAAAAAAAK
jgi:hypothetical protein